MIGIVAGREFSDTLKRIACFIPATKNEGVLPVFPFVNLCLRANNPTKKICAGLFRSWDGVTKSPDRWHLPYVNEERGEVGSGMAAADTLLLGRVTYQEFAGYWGRQRQ